MAAGTSRRSRYHYVSSTINHDTEAMIHERYKLIVATDGSTVALYDLEADPLEQTDLAPRRAAVVAELQQAIADDPRRQRARLAGAATSATVRQLRDEAAKETEKNLRDLGYLN